MTRAGRLVVISGPSGVGKSSVCEKLAQLPGFERVVTCTTRPRREGEKEGEHYHFLSRGEFEEGIRKGTFLEHALVYHHLYGTPRGAVEDGIRRGRTVLLNIDVQGASQVREAVHQVSGRPEERALSPDVLTMIFLLPPDMQELERRLSRRHTESREEISRRLEVAREELLQKDAYDYRIVNRDLSQAVRDILERLGEVCRTGQ